MTDIVFDQTIAATYDADSEDMFDAALFDTTNRAGLRRQKSTN